LEHFEKAEDLSVKLNNKGNVQMLREACQCIKIYLEHETQGTLPKENEGSGGSDDEDLQDELLK
jgi:hypothetical protein